MRQRRQHTDSRRAAQTDGETPQKPTQTDTEKGADTMTTTERAALDRINRRQNAANLFTNITPADIANEVKAMKEEADAMNAIPNLGTVPAAVKTATPAQAATVRAIIRRHGGNRERAIMDAPHTMERGETWNADHKVINVLEVAADIDGYRAGFAVDLVTRSIVG